MPEQTPHPEPEKKEDDGGEATDAGGSAGNLTSPEGILMLCIAGLIDVVSFIPFLNFISWLVGIIIIGGWYAVFHFKQATKSAAKKLVIRILIALGIEIIPVASALPGWTWFVYKTLKDG